MFVFCFFFRHQQLTKLLRRYINEPFHHKPTESHGKYFSRVSLHDVDTGDEHWGTLTLDVYMLTFSSHFLTPVLFYWTLFFPTLSGAAILLIAAMVGGYGGITCGLLFPWLARSIFTQYHRMTTYQRFHQNCVPISKHISVFVVSLVMFHPPSLQVAQPDLLGNPLSWPGPFPALLLWKNYA